MHTNTHINKIWMYSLFQALSLNSQTVAESHQGHMFLAHLSWQRLPVEWLAVLTYVVVGCCQVCNKTVLHKSTRALKRLYTKNTEITNLTCASLCWYQEDCKLPHHHNTGRFGVLLKWNQTNHGFWMLDYHRSHSWKRQLFGEDSKPGVERLTNQGHTTKWRIC